ncbi:gamma-glutamylcyclotransferase [Paraburkholderia largidicola]|uniref:glutathione-specific gamma-glutamylcyclotransferase n=1 Tax=Paraburkholderia largidicola TaxID=3014751 RepID=A0A7I8C349_9BURK|nr:gamma-glutamylcyclotransferase [Paraburkholderia sp. PGU16]BCF95065.1 gamma-glutamylcyclotransferase [Paraburkholderia sp. PGU16]
MPAKADEDFHETILSRELLVNGTLHSRIAQAAGLGLLWTSEQMRRSLSETMEGIDQSNVWIFAYGSLIWNPIFQVALKRTARIYGYHRGFYLSSVVGRGNPEQPGIMLALDAGGSCDGVVLKIGGDDVQTELELLWKREMLAGSYHPRWVMGRSSEGDVRALTFVANRGAPNYIGRISDEEAARRLMIARGPLGSNLDYVRRTHAGLETHGIHDRNVARLLLACDASQCKGS